jgi:hypothetical protein
MTAAATTTEAPSPSLQRLLTAPLSEAVILATAALIVYWITGPPITGDVWPPLAEAFLEGRLHLAEDRPWLELVPRGDGSQYVPLPPVPAITLMPLIAAMGLLGIPGTPDGNIYASAVGAANVGLAYWMLLGWGLSPAARRWLTVGFAFTTHWWVAGMAGPHQYAQVCGVFFSLLALNLAVRRRWPVAAGLLLGLSAAARLPMGLALPVLLAFYGSGWRPTRAQLHLLTGLALPALAVAWYNLARFGSPFDFGYARIPHGDEGQLVTDEPWFSEGLLSISYVPRHLKVIFLDGFQVVAEAPYLKPPWSGMSLVLTAPFVFLGILARGRLALILTLGIGLVMLPNLLHGTWGFAQFGYRFILDAMPLILLLVGIAFRERIEWLARFIIAFGIAIHAYGIFVINVLGFVG